MASGVSNDMLGWSAEETGRRCTAKELYDPSVPLLARVFAGQPIFPAAAFASPDWLKVSAQNQMC